MRRSSFPLYLNGLGNVTPYNSVIVRARVDGQIMSVNFQEGDLVKEGQVLFSIDPRPYQMVLAQAEKQYAGDQARLDAAQVDLGRYRTLAARNAIQQGQVDEEVALVAQLDGTVKADAVALESAKLQISYATVTAPIAGRIGLRRIDSGNIVRAADGTALAMIAQIQPIAVIFDLAEDNLQSVLTKLRSGVRLPTELFNRDHSKKLATGYLLTVDNQIDATTGTAKLKAIFSNTEEELFPNQFVNVRLLLDTLHDQIVIPTAAVQRSSEGAYVYVVDDNSTVHVRQITLGASADSDSQILKGLEEGQRVVVAGIDRLENNVQVRVRE